jgi:hypothetical protein
MPSLFDLCWNGQHFIVFDESTKSWYCTLCATGPMSTQAVADSHKFGARHAAKLKSAELKYERTMPQRVKWCLAIAPAIAKLPTEKWRWHMNHLCHTFVTSQSSLHEYTILDTLAMYQGKEKLSLLDLAIWKHQCLSSFAEMTCAHHTVSMQDIKDYGTTRDERFAPAQFRNDVRVHGRAWVIVERVLPFLGRRF